MRQIERAARLPLLFVNAHFVYVLQKDKTNTLQKHYQEIYMHLCWLRQLLMEQKHLCLASE